MVDVVLEIFYLFFVLVDDYKFNFWWVWFCEIENFFMIILFFGGGIRKKLFNFKGEGEVFEVYIYYYFVILFIIRINRIWEFDILVNIW